MSVLNDTTVNGRVTQTMAASQPNHLVRLAEAQALLASFFQGAWNSTTTFTAGQMVTDGGSMYIANATTLNQQPSANPGVWRLAAAAGSNGSSVFPYTAYASDASGTGFSLTPASGLNYVAFLLSPTVISSPNAANFTGLWGKYVGVDGSAGATGPTGSAGAAAYGYIAYASDYGGAGFSLTPGSGLNFIAFLISPTVIATPSAANFTGLWKNYASTFAVSGALTFTGGTLGLNAASANTVSYLVQRDSNGDFAARTVTLTSLVVGSATLAFSTALTINTAVTISGALTVGSLSGVLKAAAGVLAGGATTDDLTEGSTNQYFTAARVRTTPLTGISSTNVILATDSVLTAFGKIDNLLGGNYAAGTVSGNFSVTGTLTVAGVTTLATSLSGVLKATSGVVSGGATTDNVPVGSTNLYWTQTLFNTAIAAIKNVASGIAPLDSSGKVPLANLYAYGATPYGAASQSAMLGLSAAKQGDFCLRSDTNVVYVLSNNIPSVLSNWSAFVYPVMSVNGATGTVVLTTDTVAEGSTNLYFTNARADARITAARGAASGICPLDASSLVPAANLPPIGNSIWIVNSQSTQTNLSSALKGDLANRTDQSLTYILSNNTPSSFASWVPILYPVSSVNGATGTVVLTTTNVAEGTALYFTNARAIAATLTAFTAGTGTVTSSDTVLTALQKVAANAAAAFPTTGGTLTGVLAFSGTSNNGLRVNNLTAAQITALTGTNGSIVYQTDGTPAIRAFVNGGWITLGTNSSLPLAAGSGSPLTGTLYFQDGLSSYLYFGSGGQWSQRASNSDLNFDFQQNGTTVLTLDTSNNVTIPNGVLKVGTHQVVGAQQTAEADFTAAGGWGDGTAYTDFSGLVAKLNAALAKLRAHGLIAP